MAHTYSSARAFRVALETRILRQAREQGGDHRRLRTQVAFERFLARLFADQDSFWLVKGGAALEMRLGGRARATRDLDLALPSPIRIAPADDEQIERVVDALQQAVNRTLEDWFVFRLGGPLRELTTPPYGGARLLVTTLLDQRIFVKFHLDLGLGDAVIFPPEWLTGSDLLAFAGLDPIKVAVLPVAQQFAEKVHAWTLPRDRQENSRVKDLVDLILLIEVVGLPQPEQVLRAVRATFARRRTHEIPSALPGPRAIWRAPYAELAQACQLQQVAMEEAVATLSAYWQEVVQALPPENDEAEEA
jgi:hypothetical protein